MLLACLALAGCTDLSPLRQGVCGNEVLDPGEDCDVFTDATLGSGTACGKPATPAECRYVCSVTTSCPIDWDCGSDGTCRRASGELRAGPSSPGWFPASFEPVDFNGDGHIDLAGAFADRIEFRTGDGSGSFVAGVAAPALPVSGDIAVGDLDHDPRGDIVLPTSSGLSVWRGQAQGPPLQAAYAAYALLVDGVWGIPLPDPRAHNGNGGYLVMLFPFNGGTSYVIMDGNQRTDPVPFGEGEAVDRLGDRVAVADLDGDGDDDFAVGFRGSSAIRVNAVRRDLLRGGFFLGGPTSTLPKIVDVSQPRGATTPGFQIGGEVQIADVDGDGQPDLLVSVTGPSTGAAAVAVALGLGKGEFGEAYLDPRFSEPPLATGDLNADGVADYVGPSGVFLAGPRPPHNFTLTYPRSTLEPWTAVTLGDVDGDGTVDVVAIAAGDPFVDVLRCDNGDSTCLTTGRFAPRRYSTELGVTRIRAQRLQGLRAVDLALVESAGERSPKVDDALSVMYGQPLGWPEAPVRQARFHRIDHLEMSHPGAFADVLVSTRSADLTASYGVLDANGTRELNSPFLLATDATNPGNEYSAAKQALVGRFSPISNLRDDLIVIGQSPANVPRAWWVPGADDAAFAPTATGQDLRVAFGSQFELGCARFVAGDIDGDDRSEVVAVFGRALCGSQPSTKVAVGRPTAAGHLDFKAQELAIPDGPDGSLVTLCDLDGDGSADLVIARQGSAAVFRGGPSGLASTGAFVDLPRAEQVLGMMTIARSKAHRGANRVAVLTGASLLALSSDPLGRLQPTHLAAVSARSLRSADVDDDGLGDMLLTGVDGMDVLLTVPAAPLGGRR
jgi:hypothetical protein